MKKIVSFVYQVVSKGRLVASDLTVGHPGHNGVVNYFTSLGRHEQPFIDEGVH